MKKKSKFKVNIFRKIWHKLSRPFRCLFHKDERKVYDVKVSFGNFSRIPSDDFYCRKIPYELTWDASKTIPAFIIGILSAEFGHANGYPNQFNTFEEYQECLFLIINKLEMYLMWDDDYKADWSEELNAERFESLLNDKGKIDFNKFCTQNPKHPALEMLDKVKIYDYEVKEAVLKEALLLLSENLSSIWL